MLDKEKAKAVLSAKGMRITKQREMILDILENNYTHPTADDIINIILKKTGSVTVATVYNTLDVLSSHGLILKINGLEMKSHYDPQTHPHFHAICKKCKKVFDVEISDSLTLPEGFVLQNCLLQGICKDCK